MLSEHKSLLRVAEVLAAIGALASLAFAMRCYLGGGSEAIELAFIGGFALLMVTFGPACVLGGEYVRTVRRPQSYWQKVSGLSSSEISSLLQWAPPAYKLAAVFGVLVLVIAGLVFGSVSWSSEHPPTLRDGIAGALYQSVFFLLALPVLASAARMPGSYAESCGNDA